MNLKGFLVTTLSHALDLGMASPDDVLKHVTPELLATNLPRPLWARLLTACLGAPRVDAQLVVETIGVPNLCEHLPTQVIWNCLSEIALRSLGREFVPIAVPAQASSLGSGPVLTRPAPLAMTPPPAEKPRDVPAPKPVAVGPAIPAAIPVTPPADSLADVVAALENEDRPATPSRTRSATAARFRQSNTGIGRFAANNTRRPQAATTPTETAPPAPPVAPSRSHRRGSTEVTDYDLETDVKDDWKSSLAVEDEQPMVDWSGTSEETQNTDEYGRKR